MAGVVCEKDALALRRKTVAPRHLHAADQPRAAGDDARERMQLQRAFTVGDDARGAADERHDRTEHDHDRREPRSISPRQPTSGSTTDSTHATVITAMRCGFAIGPMKY